MPADIQVNTAQNGIWEYCFLRETYLPRQFAIIPASTTNPGSDDFEVTN